jgi:hypothetical protein
MLAFIIAVKHPARSRSYKWVTELLRQTLASVEAQTNGDFATVVVCNTRPTWAGAGKNRVFVEVDFPPAPSPSSVGERYNWNHLDKGAKNAVGLLHARQFNPTHVMFVDADDFVSRRLAEHVHLNPGAPGWYFESGLIYSGQFKIAEVRDRFWSYCGTSHILRYDLLPVDLELGAAHSLDTILQALDRFYVQCILGNHQDYFHYVATRGLELAPLPFMGAVWHADTGENASRAWWSHTRFGPVWGKALTPDELQEFHIQPTVRTIRDTVLLSGWRARSMIMDRVRRVHSRVTRGT